MTAQTTNPQTSETPSLRYLFREPQLNDGAARAPLLILLHGVGSNESDLFDYAQALDDRFFIASARAPIPLGMDAFAWYHVQFTANGPIGNDAEAEQSRQTLLRFVDELCDRHDLDKERVYLAGFSQGAIMSLYTSLTQPKRFAGVVAMSGRFHPNIAARAAAPDDLRGLPFFVVHGLRDQVLTIAEGREIQTELAKLPVEVTYQEYDMAHTINDSAFRDIRAWLTARLNTPTSR